MQFKEEITVHLQTGFFNHRVKMGLREREEARQRDSGPKQGEGEN